METKSLRTIGFNYSYKYIKNINGKSNPIFIINGAFQSMRSWTPIVSALKDKYSIILVDLPGWGNSDLLPSIYEFEIFNQFVMEILHAENIQKVNILSSSFGTLIGTSFAKCHPEHVDCMIMCSPILKIKKRLKNNYPEMLKIIESRNAKALSEFLCRIGLINCVAGNKGKIESFNLLLKKFLANISRSDANNLGKFIHNTDRILKFPNKDLSSISDKKTLILSGIYDEFTSPKECRKIARQFNDCKIKLVPRSDHMFLYEQALYSIKQIDKFLNKYSSVSQSKSVIERAIFSES